MRSFLGIKGTKVLKRSGLRGLIMLQRYAPIAFLAEQAEIARQILKSKNFVDKKIAFLIAKKLILTNIVTNLQNINHFVDPQPVSQRANPF